GLVGVRHTVDVFLFLQGRAATGGCVQDLGGQSLGHALFTAGPSVPDQPAERQRHAASRRHLDRHLIVRTAYAPRLHFDHRLTVLYRLLEDLQRLFFRALRDLLHGGVENTRRHALLAVPHHVIDEGRHEGRVKNRVRLRGATFCFSSTRHLVLWRCCLL